MKLNTATYDYLRKKSIGTPRAAISYEIWLRRLSHFVGDIELHNISDVKITEFMMFVKEKWSPKTLEYCSAVLTNFAKKYHLDWEVKVRRQRAQSHEPVTPETHKKILDLLPTNEYKYLQRNIIVRILHESGCRISECLAINVIDLNPDNNYVNVETRKTIKDRRIFWSQETHRLIFDRYLPIRMEINRGDALFVGFLTTGEYSNRLTQRSVERWYEGFSKVLGIKVVPHGERHGKAHDILDKSGSLADVMNILGHTTLASTTRYTGYGGKEMEEKANKFLS
jgi:site-specific recombinase XerC